MTCSAGNIDFCFPKTLDVPWIKGYQNSLFPAGRVIRGVAVPSNSKTEKNCENMISPENGCGGD